MAAPSKLGSTRRFEVLNLSQAISVSDTVALSPEVSFLLVSIIILF